MPTNIAPDIIDTSLPNATVGEPYEYKVSAIDYDGLPSQLTFDVRENPVWLKHEQLVPPEGQLTVELRLYGTPDFTSPDTVTVIIEVKDGIGSTTETFTLTINGGSSGGDPNGDVGAADTGNLTPTDTAPTPTTP